MNAYQPALLPGVPAFTVPQSHGDYVTRGREVAAQHIAVHGHASADNVRAVLGPPPNPHVSGALFTRRYFLQLRRVPTKHGDGHGRYIWQYSLTKLGRQVLLGEP